MRLSRKTRKTGTVSGAPFALRTIFLAPSALVMLSLFFLPLLIVLAYSFLSRGPYGGVLLPWSGESYARLFDRLYLTILWRSVWIAALATAICLVLAFPLALYIARAGTRKTLLLNLV